MTTPIGTAAAQRQSASGYALHVLPLGERLTPLAGTQPFRGVSEANLLELVAKLGHDVRIVVGPVRRRAGKIELQFA